MQPERSHAKQLIGTAFCAALALVYTRSSTPTAIPGVEYNALDLATDIPTLPVVSAVRPPIAVTHTAAARKLRPAKHRVAKVALTKDDAARINSGEALVIPVLGIKASQLHDTFNDARGAGRRHDAIDIMAPHNSPVIAAADATVMKLDRGERGGITLYALGSDNRTVYYYAHLDHYEDGVKAGTHLKAGDVLGYVGDTGNAGAGNYHLHFEITTTSNPKRYWGGTSHNPYPLLRKGITETGH